MQNLQTHPPLLIAHRGDALSFPENTPEAFAAAFAKGSDGIELDVHLRNGEVIIVHHYLFDPQVSYPLLEEVLSQFSGQGKIEIEIKEYSTEILKPLKEILSRFEHAELELTTSEIPLAIHIKNAFPHIPMGLIFHEFLFQDWMTPEIIERKVVGWGEMAKADVLHLPFKILRQSGAENLVAKLHTAGFKVHTHIFNTDQQTDELQKSTEWQVDQCTIDSIELIQQARSKS